jgi:hypothetical protein
LSAAAESLLLWIANSLPERDRRGAGMSDGIKVFSVHNRIAIVGIGTEVFHFGKGVDYDFGYIASKVACQKILRSMSLFDC